MNLKHQRETLGLSQAQMATSLGVSRFHISKIERNVFPLTTAMQLAVECLIHRKNNEDGEPMEIIPESSVSDSYGFSDYAIDFGNAHNIDALKRVVVSALRNPSLRLEARKEAAFIQQLIIK